MKYPSSPSVGLVGGKFSDGDPAQGIPASLDPASHMNAITDELLNVITGFGLVPDEFVFNQVFLALAGRVGNAGGLSFRNLLINAAGTINQRVYVSGAATTVANQYTLDRWRVVVSGQNLSWASIGAVNVMMAPAGGVEQVIEGVNVQGGTYVLNWTGTATATVNGNPVLKGGTFVLPAGVNAVLRFVGGTFSLPQIEQGTVPTAFEFRIVADMPLCERYYERLFVVLRQWGGGAETSGRDARFRVAKRVPPAVLKSGEILANCNVITFTNVGVNELRFNTLTIATGQFEANSTLLLDAEIY